MTPHAQASKRKPDEGFVFTISMSDDEIFIEAAMDYNLDAEKIGYLAYTLAEIGDRLERLSREERDNVLQNSYMEGINDALRHWEKVKDEDSPLYSLACTLRFNRARPEQK